MPKHLQVLIADHHPLTRIGIKTILEAEAEFRVSGETADGYEVQRLSLELRPDLLLLSLKLPGPSPSGLVTALCQQHPALKIVLLTTDAEIQEVPQSCPSGLAGYMLKDEAPETIVQALRNGSQGGVWFSRAIAQQLLSSQGRGLAQPQSSPLTERELEVLTLLVASQTDKQIAQALNLGERTVRYTLQRICDKLNANNRIEIVVQAFRLGLVA